MEMKFTEKYPHQPPEVCYFVQFFLLLLDMLIIILKVRFATPVYHPNIAVSGDICVDVLKAWTPNLRIHDGLLRLIK